MDFLFLCATHFTCSMTFLHFRIRGSLRASSPGMIHAKGSHGAGPAESPKRLWEVLRTWPLTSLGLMSMASLSVTGILSQAPPPTLWVGICIFTRFPSDLCTHCRGRCAAQTPSVQIIWTVSSWCLVSLAVNSEAGCEDPEQAIRLAVMLSVLPGTLWGVTQQE